MVERCGQGRVGVYHLYFRGLTPFSKAFLFLHYNVQLLQKGKNKSSEYGPVTKVIILTNFTIVIVQYVFRAIVLSALEGTGTQNFSYQQSYFVSSAHRETD